MKLALIGAKLGHSYSKIIHEMFLKMLDIEGSYELIEIPNADDLGKKVQWMEENNYKGFNITIPYKKNILNYVDSVNKEVTSIKAANTVIIYNGKREAYNTDYFGFSKSLEVNDINPAGHKWLILGSGGSSQSVKAVLKDEGAKHIYTASRNPKNNEFISYDKIEKLEGIYGVVNTTPVGMYPDVGNCILDGKLIKKFSVAVDLIYNPAETVFVQKAKKFGLVTVNGLYMLVAQAIKAQEIWNKTKYEDEIIDNIYNKLGCLNE